MMTLIDALRVNLRIEPGQKVQTFGGWCRRDKVLLDGHEIGKIQVRRAKAQTEIITIGASKHINGYDVDWLIEQSANHLYC